ncbi:MAG: methionine gamma-lyase family protein [Anaeromassilibacillus sp.]
MRSPLRSSAFCVRGYHAQRDRPALTRCAAIGLTGDGNGSLKEFGIRYEQVDLLPDGTPDYAAIAQPRHPSIKMVYIQRSRGYSLRPSLFVEDIERIAKIAKEKAPNCIVMVDNCYGEFVQRDGHQPPEPT